MTENHYELRAEQDVERVSCYEDGCLGCRAVHRRCIDPPRFYIGDDRVSRALYEKAIAEQKR